MCCVSCNVHGHDVDAKTCNMLTVTAALVARASHAVHLHISYGHYIFANQRMDFCSSTS